MSGLADWLPPIVARWLRRILWDVVRGGFVGLNGLDRRLVDRIKPGRGGYFVELGANDGVCQSNTYMLQRRYGWTGLLIEPSPLLFEQCVANRRFGTPPHVRCAACVPFDYREPFVPMLEAGLMTVAGRLDLSEQMAADHAARGAAFLPNERTVYSFAAPGRTLTSLLDEVDAPLCIDLLSLDVEGNELAVLRGLDLSRYKVRWLLIEVRRDSDIPTYLAEQGYRHVIDLTTNDTYRDALFAASETPC